MTPEEALDCFRKAADDLGFSALEVAPVEPLDKEAEFLHAWLQAGMHAGMDYMERHARLRADVRRLLPSARSVIVLTHPYLARSGQPEGCTYKVARYAQIKDYHKVLKKKLKRLVRTVQEVIGPFEYRLAVDSAPVMEKAWAVRAGIGWAGKNGNLLRPREGSFFFLSEIITNLELPGGTPMRDLCGTCRRCIEACPTDAIVADGVVDARKCIAYHTIERKDEFSEEDTPVWDDWIFGCDICQEVCPWNIKFARSSDEPRFQPVPAVRRFRDEDWESLTPEIFDEAFAGTPLKRAKYEGLMRNIRWVKKHRKKP